MSGRATRVPEALVTGGISRSLRGGCLGVTSKAFPQLKPRVLTGVCGDSQAQGFGHRIRGGHLTRGSVACPHDRQPKGQCRVGARQPCGATSLSAPGGGDGTRSLIAFQDLARLTCASWSGPASGPKPRKKRSGTGRPMPMAPSDNL